MKKHLLHALAVSAFTVAGAAMAVAQEVTPDANKWYRLVGDTGPAPRTGMCIEVANEATVAPQSSTPGADNYGKLWCGVPVAEDASNYAAQLWRFEEDPANAGHYAMISKSAEKGSVNGDVYFIPDKASNFSRWNYNFEARDYSIVLAGGDYYKTLADGTPGCAIKSSKVEGTGFMNLSAAGQGFSINWYGNPLDGDDGIFYFHEMGEVATETPEVPVEGVEFLNPVGTELEWGITTCCQADHGEGNVCDGGKMTDGDASSYWHMAYDSADAANRHTGHHYFVFDLKEPRELTGFTWTARANSPGAPEHGLLRGWEVYVSDNAADFAFADNAAMEAYRAANEAAADGASTVIYDVPGANTETYNFGEAAKGRYVLFVASQAGQKGGWISDAYEYLSCAEFSFMALEKSVEPDPVDPGTHTYVTFEAGRTSGFGKYLNAGLAANGIMTRSDVLTSNAIWEVTPGSAEGAYYVQNFVTKEYLMNLVAYNSTTVAEPKDIYFLDYNGGIQLCVDPVANNGNCLDADNADNHVGVWGNDAGCVWYKSQLDATTPAEVEAYLKSLIPTEEVAYAPIARNAEWTVSACTEAPEEGGGNGYAKNIIDSNPSTYWHTAWSKLDNGTSCYHYFEIDLGAEESFEACGFTQRQTASFNGAFAEAKVYVSNEPFSVSHETIVDYVANHEANLTATLKTTASGMQYFDFPETQTGRYILVVPTITENPGNPTNPNNKFACLAEFGLFNKTVTYGACIEAYMAEIDRLAPVAARYTESIPFLSANVKNLINGFAAEKLNAATAVAGLTTAEQAVEKANEALAVVEAAIVAELKENALTKTWIFRNVKLAADNQPSYLSGFRFGGWSHASSAIEEASAAAMVTLAADGDNYSVYSVLSGMKFFQATNFGTDVGVAGYQGDNSFKQNFAINFEVKDGYVNLSVPTLGTCHLGFNSELNLTAVGTNGENCYWTAEALDNAAVAEKLGAIITSWGAHVPAGAEKAAAAVANVNAAETVAAMTDAVKAARTELGNCFKTEEEVALFTDRGFVTFDMSFVPMEKMSDESTWLIETVDDGWNPVTYKFLNKTQFRGQDVYLGAKYDGSQQETFALQLDDFGTVTLRLGYTGPKNTRLGVQGESAFMVQDETVDNYLSPDVRFGIGLASEFAQGGGDEEKIAVIAEALDNVKALIEVYKTSVPFATEVFDEVCGMVDKMNPADFLPYFDFMPDFNEFFMGSIIAPLEEGLVEAINESVATNGLTLYQPKQKGYLSANTKVVSKYPDVLPFNYQEAVDENAAWQFVPAAEKEQYYMKSAKGEFIGGVYGQNGNYTSAVSETAQAYIFKIGVKDGYVYFETVSKEGFGLGLDCQSDPAEIMSLTDGSTGYQWMINTIELPKQPEPAVAVKMTVTPASGALQSDLLNITFTVEGEVAIDETAGDITLSKGTNVVKTFGKNDVSEKGGVYTIIADQTANGTYTLMIPEGFLRGEKVYNEKTVVTWTLEKDGIAEIMINGKVARNVFDLQGRRVSKVGKGLYIVDGVKTLVK